MNKQQVYIEFEMLVECPGCKEFFDISDGQGFDDLVFTLCELKDLKEVGCKCPHCKTEIVIDNYSF